MSNVYVCPSFSSNAQLKLYKAINVPVARKKCTLCGVKLIALVALDAEVGHICIRCAEDPDKLEALVRLSLKKDMSKKSV